MIDFATLERQLIIALRGSRTQGMMNKKLGYHFNQYYRWESGKKRVMWTDFLAILKVAGRKTVFKNWLSRILSYNCNLSKPAEILERLKGADSTKEFAERLGVSRHKLYRCLAEDQEPPIRLLLMAIFKVKIGFLAGVLEDLVGLDKIDEFPLQEKSRYRLSEIFAREPILPAVIRCLELDDYVSLDRHVDGHIAARLGIPLEDERNYLRLLLEAGNLSLSGAKYIVNDTTIHFNGSFAQRQDMKRFWLKKTDESIASMKDGDESGFFGVNILTANGAVKEKISKKIYECFYEVSQILKEEDNANPEHILVVNMQVTEPFIPPSD
ncbi:DUF4423 domain-containing protein [Pseudobacteriovorax antillogorgiicola]|uniref:DUF4423 domain-containing protein n=1 Tax=Pseudobacteriovorax antillogorgiicola TaxID=1513793 RepID=A0A1Y6BID7_9BACT|nr:DUF4423 domain-containing protein [Pseudobacteriovorax antillogorgiicola]TCS56500.1 uncharacterized protein DUF4423 [Pseudobacteriovorax antillogorgiicola]SMF04681.1 protein of unknown function [Pseudobacteriovorax antillogorgiicola]